MLVVRSDSSERIRVTTSNDAGAGAEPLHLGVERSRTDHVPRVAERGGVGVRPPSELPCGRHVANRETAVAEDHERLEDPVVESHVLGVGPHARFIRERKRTREVAPLELQPRRQRRIVTSLTVGGASMMRARSSAMAASSRPR